MARFVFSALMLVGLSLISLLSLHLQIIDPWFHSLRGATIAIWTVNAIVDFGDAITDEERFDV